MQTQRQHVEFRGPMDCLVKTVRGEGIRGLYKGMMSPLVGATLTKTVNFGAFGFLVAGLKDKGKPATLPQMIVAGSLSAVTASLILTPVDRAKILLQIQRTAEERALAEG